VSYDNHRLHHLPAVAKSTNCAYALPDVGYGFKTCHQHMLRAIRIT